MPTEATFLLAGLLFLAAALGYFFARFGDEEDEDAAVSSGRLNEDYIKGLNFLLNEQPDRALEVFMRMVEVDDETLETHFALGSLLRRRGEFERAIRVHQNIIARPNLSVLHRDQALLSLADDYLSAGLFDRSEKLFQQLRESSDHRAYAIEKLSYIYETTQEWENAIKTCLDQPLDERETEGVSRISHYFCELAEDAVEAKDYAQARGFLKRARSNASEPWRANLAMADLDQLTGKHKSAVKAYQEIMESRPNLIVDIIPRLAASCRALNDQKLLSKALQQLHNKAPENQKAIALAAVHDKNIVNEIALECLRNYVVADGNLSQLVDVEGLVQGDMATRATALERVRAGLHSLDSQRLRYQCKSCGYSTSVLMWQCPSCRTWESVAPVTAAVSL